MAKAIARCGVKNGLAKNRKVIGSVVIGVALFACSPFVKAQKPASWNDDLADKLVGVWDARGSVMGRLAHHRITARWVLNHQFIELHEQTSPEASSSESRYDAIWYFGHDDITQHYVLHLMDLFGGRYSETLGDGTRNENDFLFVFAYPDGPFRTTWSWQPPSRSWKWHMEQKDKAGEWKVFADFSVTQDSPGR